MFIVYNAIVLGLVLLIGYWWANQGLFSAIIHLLSVIVAGALALAFWEPVTLGLLLKGSKFDPYAWGVSLLGVFVVALFILRLATNRLVPANVKLPRWADLAFGFPVGLASGVLTIGLAVIGVGYVQSTSNIMDFDGWSRGRGGKVEQVDRLWLPVHTLTDKFYSALSVGAFSTSRPLRQYNPMLDRQAASLVRDSWNGGRGEIDLRPSQASVQSAWLCPDRVVVAVRFDRGARDYGEQLTVSSSQVRLVSEVAGSAAPTVMHPQRWSQETASGQGIFTFDHVSHFATTVPGREQATILFEFQNWPQTAVPRFIQVKNTRFDIARQQIQQMESCEPIMRGGSIGERTVTAADFAGVGVLNPRDIRVSNDIRPVMTSTNTMPGTIEHTDRLLTKGFATFDAARTQIARNLRIEGLYEPAGTKVVQVEVGRSSSANIYDDHVWNRAGSDPRAQLWDDKGNPYSAIGYIYEGREGTEIRLDPTNGLSSKVLPILPTSGRERMRLLFHVTQGTQLIGLTFGDAAVASCDVYVADEGGTSIGADGGAVERPENPEG